MPRGLGVARATDTLIFIWIIVVRIYLDSLELISRCSCLLDYQMW